MSFTRPAKHRLFLLVSLAFAVYVGRTPGQNPGDTREPLRNMSQVLSSLRDPSVQSLKIDVEATVTFWHPERQKLFVQNEGKAIYVKLPRDRYREIRDLRVGSRVRIVGRVDTKKCLVFADRVEILSHGAPPDPIHVELDGMAKGAFWSRRVEMEGVVESVVHGQSHAEITIVMNDRRAVCNCLGHSLPSKTTAILGAKIQIIGAMDWSTHASGSPRTAICHVASFSDVKILSSAESRDLPTRVKTLTTACATEVGNHITCNGIVTFVGDGEFLLEDEGNSLLVRYSGDGTIFPNAQLKVTGHLLRDLGGVYLQLEESTGSEVGESPRGVVRTNAKQIAADQLSRCRVSVQGTLLEHFNSGDSRKLTLEEQGLTYKIYFVASDDRFEALKLREGQDVRCLGLLTHAPASEDAWFAVMANSVDDIWPSHNALRISQEEILWWLAVCSTLLLVAITWSATLRVQVKRKTRNLASVTTRLNASYDAINEGILVYGATGATLSCNRRFGELTGLAFSTGDSTHILSRHIKARFRIDGDESIFESKTISTPTTVHLTSIRKPQRKLVGYFAPVRNNHGDTDATLLTLTDVTKQKELEAALVQSQKMEAVGQLAGGIAHDFNNLLMVIISNLDLARDSSPTDPFAWDETLNAANRAAERAGDLVKKLLGFSRLSALEIQTASLNAIAKNVAALVRRSFKSTVRIETEFEPTLRPTKVDPAQIEQVLMNVCLNARDALRNDSGRIRISTSNFSLKDGDYVKVSVEDDGVGMSQDVASRMFEPFYTTKATDEGTGLGMSMSYGIVSQHGGWIECNSQPGQGTRIDVILPQSNDEMAEKGDHEVIETPNATVKRTGRVLVVDDEDAVRRATCGLLTSLGFDVDDAENGIDGLRMLSEDAYDLLVLDLNMPLLSGHDVCAELSESQPQLPVIICTGYLTEKVVIDNRPATGQTISVLQKPFRVEDLKIAVEESLGARLAS